jgi:MFS family permease
MVAVMSMTPVHMQHMEHALHAGPGGGGDTVLKLIGIVISGHTLGMFAFSPLVGWLADRIGTRPVIVAGLVMLVASVVLAPLAGARVPLITVALFLLGLGWSCGLIAGSAQLSLSTTPVMRPAAQGVSDVVMNAAGALGGALAGLLIAATSYQTLGFLAAGLVVVVGAFAVGRRSGIPTEPEAVS